MSSILDIHKLQATLPLQGDRVLVRPFVSSDLAINYVSWLNDPETMQYSSQRFRSHSLDSVQLYFDSFLDSPNTFLAIESQQNNQLVGTITVYIQPYHGTADVGILIGKGGKGHGAEAWCLVINWLLETCKARKVTAGTLDCNYRMIRLMELANMQLEATRRAQELVDGNPQDILYFAKFHAV
jgi:RimJ/RimL family protein N-acetyltransferase